MGEIVDREEHAECINIVLFPKLGTHLLMPIDEVDCPVPTF